MHAGDSAVLEEESPSRGTYTVNNVPVSVERHTPRQYDGIQRPTVDGYSASQSAPAPRSSGKKRRLESDAEYWAEQGYVGDPDGELIEMQEPWGHLCVLDPPVSPFCVCRKPSVYATSTVSWNGCHLPQSCVL